MAEVEHVLRQAWHFVSTADAVEHLVHVGREHGIVVAPVLHENVPQVLHLVVNEVHADVQEVQSDLVQVPIDPFMARVHVKLMLVQQVGVLDHVS